MSERINLQALNCKTFIKLEQALKERNVTSVCHDIEQLQEKLRQELIIDNCSSSYELNTLINIGKIEKKCF